MLPQIQNIDGQPVFNSSSHSHTDNKNQSNNNNSFAHTFKQTIKSEKMIKNIPQTLPCADKASEKFPSSSPNPKSTSNQTIDSLVKNDEPQNNLIAQKHENSQVLTAQTNSNNNNQFANIFLNLQALTSITPATKQQANTNQNSDLAAMLPLMQQIQQQQNLLNNPLLALLLSQLSSGMMNGLNQQSTSPSSSYPLSDSNNLLSQNQPINLSNKDLKKEENNHNSGVTFNSSNKRLLELEVNQVDLQISSINEEPLDLSNRKLGDKTNNNTKAMINSDLIEISKSNKLFEANFADNIRTYAQSNNEKMQQKKFKYEDVFNSNFRIVWLGPKTIILKARINAFI